MVLYAQDLQLHSQSDLVVAPVSVTNRKGASVEGLSGADLILYDNNVPRAIHVDDVFVPVSLVLVVQATGSALPVLEKLRKEASLLEPLIAGDEGDAALIAFASEIKVLNDFTPTSTPSRSRCAIWTSWVGRKRQRCGLAGIAAFRNAASRAPAGHSVDCREA